MNDKFHESLIKRIFNWLVVLCLKITSFLPFFLLYRIADVLYLLVKNVFRYRREVIITNLKNSFPEKSDKEIEIIAGKFYRHFCDMLVESIKIYSISKRKLEKRIHFKSIDLVNSYLNKGKSVIVVGMHYNNWEWCMLSQDKVKHPFLVLYNPIRGNKAFEGFLLKYRERYRSILLPVHKSSRTIINYLNSGKPFGIWLLADQSPAPTTKSWIMFFNQETPFFSGPEKIAFRSKQPVIFEHVKKVGRGRYEVYHYPVFENYDGMESKDILIKYARLMEALISENPEYYLWSHRRWKHKRPENVPLTV